MRALRQEPDAYIKYRKHGGQIALAEISGKVGGSGLETFLATRAI